MNAEEHAAAWSQLEKDQRALDREIAERQREINRRYVELVKTAPPKESHAKS